MNQSVLLPEQEWWDETCKAVCFPALVGGMQCVCAISAEQLFSRFGNVVTDPITLFQQNRWDLEDDAQRIIEAQDDDDDGWFWLSANK